MKSLQSIVQKSRVQKLILSPVRSIFLSSALAFSSASCMPCYGNDSNCSESEICVENACVPQEGREEESGFESGNAGVFSQQEYANAQGEAKFFSPRGDFSFAIRDFYSGERLSAVKLDFIQGDGFSLLTSGKTGYIQHLEILPPDTPGRDTERKRTIGLLPSTNQHVLIFDYYFSSHEEEVLTLSNYLEWAEDAYIFQGCVNKDELQQGRDYTMALFSFISSLTGGVDYFKVIAKVYGAVLEAGDLGVLNTLSYDKYKVYDPLNFTAPPLLEGIISQEMEEECN